MGVCAQVLCANACSPRNCVWPGAFCLGYFTQVANRQTRHPSRLVRQLWHCIRILGDMKMPFVPCHSRDNHRRCYFAMYRPIILRASLLALEIAGLWAIAIMPSKAIEHPHLLWAVCLCMRLCGGAYDLLDKDRSRGSARGCPSPTEESYSPHSSRHMAVE